MADSNIGAGGNDVLVPEEQLGNIDVVELNYDFGNGPVAATEVAIGSAVSDVTTKITDADAVVFAGRAMRDSEIRVKKSPGNTATLRLENTLNENVEIRAKGKVAVDLNIAEGKFRQSSFSAGKGKQDDSVAVGSSAKLINSSFDLKKGDDTFDLTGGATLKGDNTVDLGKKGTDTVVVGESIDGNGSLIISNMDKRDVLNVGGEEITLRDINKGNAELPDFISLGE